MAWKYPDDIIHRKLRYLATLASPDGINLSMDRWISTLKDIQLEISYETIYRLLEEIYLILNSGFDWSDFDFPPLPDDFYIPDIVTPPVEEGGKAYYDISYYNNSYYDPPEVTFKDLERYAWDNRYAISEKGQTEYKKLGKALKDFINAKKSGITEAGYADYMADVVEGTLAMVESRILNGFYVGFAIVGLSKVSKKHEEGTPFRARVDTRHPDNWESEIPTESVLCWESLVGWMRVGHFRVGAWYQIMNKQVSDIAVERINAFWLRSGLVTTEQVSKYGGIDYGIYGQPPYGAYIPEELKTLWQRIFMLQRVDQYHYKGGAKQLQMQSNTNKIRAILDRTGVIGVMRTPYVCYGNEIFFKDGDSGRLYKRWKKLISIGDIRVKYVKMGCDESILNEIERSIVP